jgi:hypothetical protein
MISEYNPERPQDLGDDLVLIVDNYWEDYDAYWELGEDPSESQFSEAEREHHKELAKLGEALREMLHTLAPNTSARDAIHNALGDIKMAGGFSQEVVAGVARVLHSWPIVRDRLTIGLYSDGVHRMLPTAEERAPHLVGLVGAVDLSPRAAAYLDRATRLYLWGFDPECVIMCRSVLEAALETALQHRFDQEFSPSLDRLIAEAGETGLLPGRLTWNNKRGWKAERGSLLWKAELIRFGANPLLHNLPSLAVNHPDDIGDSRTALSYLADVVSALFPALEDTP